MDTVAFRLPEAIAALDGQQIKYSITPTLPVTKHTHSEDGLHYVVRQTVDSEGVYHLVIAAKMGRKPVVE